MRITALLENTTERPDVAVEHGLSLYIESEGRRILFDMGQSDLFARNAEVLGIDLSGVELAVLSHGHYDHGGGLPHFLRINDHAPVYVHRDAFLPHYHGLERFIGIDPALQAHPRIVKTDGELTIAPGLTLCRYEGQDPYAPQTPELTEQSGGHPVPDDFRHEQYLLIEEKGRRILISGCSHRGVIGIAKQFSPDVLVGGFHFSKLPTDDALRQAGAVLASLPVKLYTCHCTGREQFAFLQKGNPALSYLSCGQTITL